MTAIEVIRSRGKDGVGGRVWYTYLNCILSEIAGAAVGREAFGRDRGRDMTAIEVIRSRGKDGVGGRVWFG